MVSVSLQDMKYVLAEADTYRDLAHRAVPERIMEAGLNEWYNNSTLSTLSRVEHTEVARRRATERAARLAETAIYEI